MRTIALLLLAACSGEGAIPLDAVPDAGRIHDARATHEEVSGAQDAGLPNVPDGAPCIPLSPLTSPWRCVETQRTQVWECRGLTAQGVNAPDDGCRASGDATYDAGTVLCCLPDLPPEAWPGPYALGTP